MCCVKRAARCCADISGGAGENRSAGRFFSTWILRHFFQHADYVYHTPSNSRGNEIPSWGSASNKHIPATQKNTNSPVCSLTAIQFHLSEQAENVLTQPFPEEIRILPFQRCRFGDCFLSLCLQSGTKNRYFVDGFPSSKFWIWIHWMPTLSCLSSKPS